MNFSNREATIVSIIFSLYYDSGLDTQKNIAWLPGNSLGLRVYITVYPSSYHNKDTGLHVRGALPVLCLQHMCVFRAAAVPELWLKEDRARQAAHHPGLTATLYFQGGHIHTFNWGYSKQCTVYFLYFNPRPKNFWLINMFPPWGPYLKATSQTDLYLSHPCKKLQIFCEWVLFASFATFLQVWTLRFAWFSKFLFGVVKCVTWINTEQFTIYYSQVAKLSF